MTVTLWTTALAGRRAYVTRVRHLRNGHTRAEHAAVDGHHLPPARPPAPASATAAPGRHAVRAIPPIL